MRVDHGGHRPALMMVVGALSLCLEMIPAVRSLING
jgi:hypothetical protein